MRRINTAFLKKLDVTNNVENLCVVELVESTTGFVHLLVNTLNYNTKEFSKIELLKTHHDQEEAETRYFCTCESKIQAGYKLAETGDTFHELREILEYTNSYVDREIKMLVEDEQPRLIRV